MMGVSFWVVCNFELPRHRIHCIRVFCPFMLSASVGKPHGKVSNAVRSVFMHLSGSLYSFDAHAVRC